MAAPIVLWNPELSAVRQSDDAGNKIIRTTLPLLPSFTPSYRAYDPTQSRNFTRVPRLASFCIRVLSQYPEQLHQLGTIRLHFHPEKDGADSVLRSVLPKWKTPDFSLLNVDPRLWATIVQIYRNAPEILSSYPCHLSDPHVPLLNQIPCTPDFALLTVLNLAGSRNVTDDNILSLKVLHNLTALDLSGSYEISARGIVALSRTVAFNEVGEKRGPWILRILRLRSCQNVDKVIFNVLHSFPLLAIVDLRDTQCKVQDVKRPFFSAEDNVFDIPLIDAVKYLSRMHRFVFPNENPFILSLQEEPLRSSNRLSVRPTARRVTTTMPSRHNSFVVLPASRGSTNSTWRQEETIRIGNTDADEFLERQAEKQERERRRNGREDMYDEPSYSDEDCSCSCGECCNYESDDYASEGDEDSSESINDSDVELLYALQESITSRSEERNAATSSEIMTPISRVEEPHTAQRGANDITASVDIFYQEKRTLTTIPPPRRRVYGSYDLALLRIPPAWHTLESLTANAANVRKTYLSSVKYSDKEPRMAVKRKRIGEASVKVLHTELSKRRRGSVTVNSFAHERTLSPPPSPTLTVCDPRDMRVQREPPLQPISSLRHPPRSSLIGRPRLKLEATVKTAERSSLRPAAHFSGVVNQRVVKSRTRSLAEGFELQSRKPSSAAVTGVLIKPLTSRGSGDERRSNGSAHETAKSYKDKRKKIEVNGKVSEFDWERWRKR
ncbi:hypothetical protein ACEPAI_5104 [Sanghuangporus weigelae]